MSGEIVRFDKGDRGREHGPKILGAADARETQVQRLDSKTQPEPTQVDLRVHEDHVVESDKLRHKPNESGVEIRVRHSGTSKKDWERIKRAEDE